MSVLHNLEYLKILVKNLLTFLYLLNWTVSGINMPRPNLQTTVSVNHMSRHFGLLILAVIVITYLEAIPDDWIKITPLGSGRGVMYKGPRMFKRSIYGKRKEVPWTRLKRSETEWMWFRIKRSEASDKDWTEDKRGQAWTILKEDTEEGMGEYSSECQGGVGWNDKLFWAKFSKISF